MRITMKQLEERITTLNDALGYSREPYSPFTHRANPNTFYVGQAYGGYRLEQIVSESGAARDISPRGTKREVYNYVDGMLKGVWSV